MSKTYLDQVGKAKDLLKGVRKNFGQVEGLGIKQEDLSMLEAAISAGEQLNGEVEHLRAETSKAVAQANQKLGEIKETVLAMKRTIKQNYDMSRWIDFGIPDKR